MKIAFNPHLQMWVPPGFVHGFFVLSDSVDSLYKTTDYYAAEHERCVHWNDPDLAIRWPLQGEIPLLSAKDALGESFAETAVFEW